MLQGQRQKRLYETLNMLRFCLACGFPNGVYRCIIEQDTVVQMG
jgi:hypothetical protein